MRNFCFLQVHWKANSQAESTEVGSLWSTTCKSWACILFSFHFSSSGQNFTFVKTHPLSPCAQAQKSKNKIKRPQHFDKMCLSDGSKDIHPDSIVCWIISRVYRTTLPYPKNALETHLQKQHSEHTSKEKTKNPISTSLECYLLQ